MDPTTSGFNYRRKWTLEEDEQLRALVTEHGAQGQFAVVARLLTHRTAKQCRERWKNIVLPGIKKRGWTEEEDATIERLHAEIGNKWVTIAALIPGRGDNAVKNRFYSNMRKQGKLLGQQARSVDGDSQDDDSDSDGEECRASDSLVDTGIPAVGSLACCTRVPLPSTPHPPCQSQGRPDDGIAAHLQLSTCGSPKRGLLHCPQPPLQAVSPATACATTPVCASALRSPRRVNKRTGSGHPSFLSDECESPSCALTGTGSRTTAATAPGLVVTADAINTGLPDTPSAQKRRRHFVSASTAAVSDATLLDAESPAHAAHHLDAAAGEDSGSDCDDLTGLSTADTVTSQLHHTGHAHDHLSVAVAASSSQLEYDWDPTCANLHQRFAPLQPVQTGHLPNPSSVNRCHLTALTLPLTSTAAVFSFDLERPGPLPLVLPRPGILAHVRYATKQAQAVVSPTQSGFARAHSLPQPQSSASAVRQLGALPAARLVRPPACSTSAPMSPAVNVQVGDAQHGLGSASPRHVTFGSPGGSAQLSVHTPALPSRNPARLKHCNSLDSHSQLKRQQGRTTVTLASPRGQQARSAPAVPFSQGTLSPAQVLLFDQARAQMLQNSLNLAQPPLLAAGDGSGRGKRHAKSPKTPKSASPSSRSGRGACASRRDPVAAVTAERRSVHRKIVLSGVASPSTVMDAPTLSSMATVAVDFPPLRGVRTSYPSAVGADSVLASLGLPSRASPHAATVAVPALASFHPRSSPDSFSVPAQCFSFAHLVSMVDNGTGSDTLQQPHYDSLTTAGATNCEIARQLLQPRVSSPCAHFVHVHPPLVDVLTAGSTASGPVNFAASAPALYVFRAPVPIAFGRSLAEQSLDDLDLDLELEALEREHSKHIHDTSRALALRPALSSSHHLPLPAHLHAGATASVGGPAEIPRLQASSSSRAGFDHCQVQLQHSRSQQHDSSGGLGTGHCESRSPSPCKFPALLSYLAFESPYKQTSSFSSARHFQAADHT